MQKLIVLVLTGGLAAASGFSQSDAQRGEEVKRLIERIAAGDGVDAKDAGEDLLDLLTGPLDAALDSFDAKTLERKWRVQEALSRLTARIRARLFFSSLPEDERAQLARFAELHQPLIDQLFSDEPQRRIEAYGRIPIEIGSGAGLAATAGLYDLDENVAQTALAVCREFVGDDMVGKGVTRFIDESIAGHKAGRAVEEWAGATVAL